MPTELTIGLILAAGAAVAFGWWWLIARAFRLTSPQGTRLNARCADGWELALYHRAGQPRRFLEPVLLCHGLAVNHAFFDFDPPYSLADYLSRLGFECFVVEWRGTGGSRRPPRGVRWSSYCFDDHIKYDGPALIDAALERAGAPRAFWLGHSLGGLIGYAVAQQRSASRLKGLVALGAPVFFRYDSLLRAAVRLGALFSWPFGFRQAMLGSALAPLAGLGLLPFKELIFNPRNVPPALRRKLVFHLPASIGRGMLLQLRDWTHHDAFRSVDKHDDYREGLRRLSLPLLVMAGSDDHLATPANAEAQFALAGSEDKTLVIFGRARGDREDYGHGDLVFGTGAPEEVFPVIGDWLTLRATRAVL